VGRVRIGSASNPADAAFLRSAFDAHDIPIVINAEEHANMLGGLGGALVPLHIYTDEEHAEGAAALLADIRSQEHEDDESENADDTDDDDASESARNIDVRLANKRKMGIAVILGLCVTFGTASLYTGAWIRGLILLVVEAVSFGFVWTAPPLGFAMLFGAMTVDVVASIMTIRAKNRTTPQAKLPEARARKL
jgi:hypothetical protein